MATETSCYAFSPNLVCDWDNAKNGYPSFRRFIEDRLKELDRDNTDDRLQKLDEFFSRYRNKYYFEYQEDKKEETQRIIHAYVKGFLYVKYPDGQVARDGRPKDYVDITSIRDCLLSLLANHSEKQNYPTKEKIDDLKKKLKKDISNWMDKPDGYDEKILKEFDVRKQHLRLMEAMNEGSYAHVVAGKGGVRLIKPTDQEVARSRYRDEMNQRIKADIKKLVNLMKSLSPESTATEIEGEVGELLFATGVCISPNPTEYVHQLLYGE